MDYKEKLVEKKVALVEDINFYKSEIAKDEARLEVINELLAEVEEPVVENNQPAELQPTEF